MNKLSRNHLLYLADRCANPQDALILQLIMEGVEIHEIVYLKRDSVDFGSRTIAVKNESDVIRKQAVSQKCATIFYNAIHQTRYLLNNGTVIEPNRFVLLKDCGFAVKPSADDFIANESMIQELDSVILRTIYNRLKSLAEVFGLPELTYLATVRMYEEVYA